MCEINLHKTEITEEEIANGIKDENVFDIMQGVSINIFVKLPKKSNYGKLCNTTI